MKTVGILGGGQLGAMLAESVQMLGADVHVFDPDPDAPALRRAARAISAPWSDVERLDAFFASCDVVTYEFENVETGGLRLLHVLDRLRPSLSVLETTQDRAKEKEFLAAAGLPHVDFRAGRDVADLPGEAAAFGFPSILKTARGGYDGKGQWRLTGPDDLVRLLGGPERAALGRGWVLEEIVDIAREASCIVARDASGDEIAFPLFENEHADHILDVTLVPARLDSAAAAVIRDVAREAAARLGVVGLLTTEFFVGRSARASTHGREAGGLRVFVNEFAPRPHNSGHVTRNACTFSQFDALARVLLGLPLTEPAMVSANAFAMGNLLGDVWLAQGREDLDLSSWKGRPEVVDVVLYGKKSAAAKRKMGHFVVADASPERALAAARAFRDALRG